MSILNNIKLSDSFVRDLPADTNLDNSVRQVFNACFSFVKPSPPSNPNLIHVSEPLADLLDLDVESSDFLNIVSGKTIISNSQPYAMCYGGHQFGHWAGQLGDGRAINIAETKVNGQYWTLQLKGAGRTPYSRTADGNAVLRSSIREYLCSEAMFHLGVPTTRALSLSLSGDEVLRDILYDGHPEYEPGAIVCRVANSFIRFGNFEIFAARKDISTLRKLTDHTIRTHYNHLGEPSKTTYLKFFEEVCTSTKLMILHWQRVGFVHGVMNTDNMSILGQTIDYGPYGWLEDYDPGWTPNTTDAQHKRYRFGNQPAVALWNLTQLANALFPLIEDVEALTDILSAFKISFKAEHLSMMLSKIGLETTIEGDDDLVNFLTESLRKTEVDMTLFFRTLSEFNGNIEEQLIKIKSSSYLSETEFDDRKVLWKDWLSGYDLRLKKESSVLAERSVKMNGINPKYVLRNYMAQLAIDAAEKEDYSILNELFNLLKFPYEEQPKMEKWFAKRPDWAKEKVGCSMLSCSS